MVTFVTAENVSENTKSTDDATSNALDNVSVSEAKVGSKPEPEPEPGKNPGGPANPASATKRSPRTRAKLVIARHTFMTQKLDKLSFRKGDVVRVVDDSGKWHLGVIHKPVKMGDMESKSTGDSIVPKRFPPNLFKPYTQEPGEPAMPPTEHTGGSVPHSQPAPQSQPRVYTTGAFKAKKDRQLSFARGDVIRVVSTSGKWHKGVLLKSSKYPITGDVLLYPPNFTKPLGSDDQ